VQASFEKHVSTMVAAASPVSLTAAKHVQYRKKEIDG
jgi:hypothetical protein